LTNLPQHARAVIIGGGVIGCSVAYHLTKLGWTDVVLLERKALTSGTTWHAAGLIGQLRASSTMTKMAKYTADLYGGLEAETGLSTGFREVGSITVALTEARREEILRQAAMGRAFGVDVEEISPREIAARYPHLNLDGVLAGVYIAKDGQGDPGNIALAMAKGARQRGAIIAEQTKVTGLTREGRRITGVDYQTKEGPGHITCDMVVNCAGMWGHEVGRMMGANVPLQACEHFYIVSEPIKGLGQLPLVFRHGIRQFGIHDGNPTYSAGSGKIFVYGERTTTRIGQNHLEESLLHESVHATLDRKYARSPEWQAAQASDGRFMTRYGESRPDREDLAETALFAYGLIYHPGRIPPVDSRDILAAVPARIAFIKDILSLTPQVPSAPTPPEDCQ